MTGGSNTPSAYALYDHGAGPRLYIAETHMTGIGGVQAYGIAAWDGQQWHSLGTTPEFRPRTVLDLCVFDDGSGPALYLGAFAGFSNSGVFTQAITRWDGSQWSSVGGGVSNPGGWTPTVRQLEVFDDGSGPALFAAGTFSYAGGLPANGIAKWDGQQWHAVGAGIGSFVDAMAVYHDTRGPSLFIGGDFLSVNGGQSKGLAQYVGCPSCYANCDNSTTGPALNVADFSCFLRNFAANNPYANCDNSPAPQALDVADFMCFLQRFAAGCP